MTGKTDKGFRHLLFKHAIIAPGSVFYEIGSDSGFERITELC